MLGAFGLFHRYLVPMLIAAGLAALAVRFPLAVTRPRAVAAVIPWETLPAVAVLLLTLATPVVFWDCCAYHLAIPEHILATGSLISKPDYVYGYYAQAMECLYALVLGAPFGEIAARIFNAAIMLSAGHAAIETLSSGERRIGFAALLATPAVLTLMALPKNSSLLALAGAVGFEALLAAPDDERARSVIVGAAGGLCVATHYGGLITATFLLAVLLARQGPRSFALATAAALPFAAPPLIRNLLLTGNPVYPFLNTLIAGHAAAPAVTALGTDLPRASVVLSRLIEPWFAIEPYGVGSTLGILFPIGIAALFVARRVTSPHLLRLGIGAGVLLTTILLYARPRYGITGLIILLPVAASGLALLPCLLARVLLAVYALVAASLLLFTGLAPLADITSVDDDAYIAHFDAAYPLAQCAAAHLPASSRIASVGILRPYRWRGMLEYASEDGPPDMARALADADTAAEALRRLNAMGYTHLAVDPDEWNRLRLAYGYLDLSADERRTFSEILARCRVTATAGRTTLYSLPGKSEAANAIR